MCGSCERGFTLMEVLVALIILSGAFTVLLEVLSRAAENYGWAEKTFRDVLILDGKLKLGDYEGLEVRRRSLPDFPKVKEITYSYGEIYFVEYELK